MASEAGLISGVEALPARLGAAGARAGARSAARAKGLKPALRALDAAALLTSWVVVLGGFVVVGITPTRSSGRTLLIGLAAVAIALGLIASKRLWLARVCSVRSVEVYKLGQVSATTAVVLLAAAELVDAEVRSLAILLGCGANFGMLVLGRGVFRAWLSKARCDGRYLRRLVLVGGNSEARHLHDLVARHPEMGFVVSGLVGAPEDADALQLPWLGDCDEIATAIEATDATGALIAGSALEPQALNRTVRRLLAIGAHVHLSSGLTGIAHDRLLHLPLAHEPLLYLEPRRLSRAQERVKRLLDVTLASLAILLLLPVLVVAAVAIKLDDGGRLLFRQGRVGRAGRDFTVFKLRTMVPDAESQLAQLRARNARMGPLFKLNGDPRVTRAGRLLRATSIDELPQLFNVLLGNMSLVGPRPPLPQEFSTFDSQLQERQRMLPGITGLWQVEARDDPSFDSYRRLDLFYVENWSVGLDLSILFNTVGVVLGRGLRALQRGRGDAVIVLD